VLLNVEMMIETSIINIEVAYRYRLTGFRSSVSTSLKALAYKEIIDLILQYRRNKE
jgi:hypothetical protein